VVIAELLGIDASAHGRFKAWSDAAVKVAFGPAQEEGAVEAATHAHEALHAFFLKEIEARRKRPGEDLISELVDADIDGDKLTDVEISKQCNLLLVAGNVTTTDLIANGLKALIDHPETLAKLRAQPALMPNTVEEVLRFDSPVTNSGRIASRDMRFDEVEIAQGESLMVSLAAANRDPAAYPEPNRFDIEREDTHHQAFGGGRHFCLGAHLARLEAQETLAALLDHFSQLGHASRGHAYAAVPAFRSLEHFSVDATTR
jgi:cytochrome P450